MQLTHVEIKRLAKLQETFPQVKRFNIVEKHLSGVGPNIRVEFSVEGLEMLTDITDHDSW